MRILVDIPQKQLDALNEITEHSGRPRAQVIRQAIAEYVASHQEPISSFFGLWADNPETQDVQGFLDKLRGEWER